MNCVDKERSNEGAVCRGRETANTLGQGCFNISQVSHIAVSYNSYSFT